MSGSVAAIHHRLYNDKTYFDDRDPGDVEHLPNVISAKTNFNGVASF